MTEMTKNDEAFIKISSELICLRNDLEALKKLKILKSRMDNWSHKQLQGLDPSAVHTQLYQGLSRMIFLVSQEGSVENEIHRTEQRIVELTTLSTAYLRGEDVVAAKLAKP